MSSAIEKAVAPVEVLVEGRPLRPWLGWAAEYPEEGRIVVDATTADEAEKLIRHHLNADDPKQPMETARRAATAADFEELQEALEKSLVARAELLAAAELVMGGLKAHIAQAVMQKRQPPLFLGISQLSKAIKANGGRD